MGILFDLADARGLGLPIAGDEIAHGLAVGKTKVMIFFHEPAQVGLQFFFLGVGGDVGGLLAFLDLDLFAAFAGGALDVPIFLAVLLVGLTGEAVVDAAGEIPSGSVDLESKICNVLRLFRHDATPFVPL